MALPLLFVCTGNVCRSPAAAALAVAAAAPAIELQASSAGLAAVVGAPVDPSTAAQLAALGVSATGHRARQYQPWMALDAALVLTATHDQSRQILRDVPQALRRVFTVKEFARLASQHRPVSGADAAQTVAAVAALRGRVPPVPDEQDDVADPYRRPDAVVRAAVTEIAAAVHGTLAAFAPPPPARRRPAPYPR